ncbi:NosD domain-containing protein [Halobacteriaceae archaeon GCM10025711]
MSSPTHRRLAVVLVLLAMAGAGVAVADPGTTTPDAPTEIHDCTTITRPGSYVLAGNVTNGGGQNFTYISETCITIEADDVVLGGNGHMVDGMGVSDTTGVGVADGAANVTVRNLELRDWHHGVHVDGAERVTVRNVDASNNAVGVAVDRATDSRVENVTVRENIVGVYVGERAADTVVADVAASGNYAADTTRRPLLETRLLLDRRRPVGPLLALLDVEVRVARHRLDGDRVLAVVDRAVLVEETVEDAVLALGAEVAGFDHQRPEEVPDPGLLDDGRERGVVGRPLVGGRCGVEPLPERVRCHSVSQTGCGRRSASTSTSPSAER